MKFTIELNPADALRLCIFLEAFKPKVEGVRQLGGLLLAVNEYQEQVYDKITDDQFEDALAEMSVAELLGMEPPSKKRMKAKTKRKIGAVLTLLLFGSIFGAFTYFACIEVALITFISAAAFMAFSRLCENLLNSEDETSPTEAEKISKDTNG